MATKEKRGNDVKILLVSDVESSYIWDHFQPEKFKDVELVISCGDLKAEYLSLIVTMIKAPVFYVPGNHDTGYEKNPSDGCDCIDGRLVNYRGIRILGLGGSMKYNGNPPFQYTEREMEWRIRKLGWSLMMNGGFDMLVTHAPPEINQSGGGAEHFGYGFKGFVEYVAYHLLIKYATAPYGCRQVFLGLQCFPVYGAQHGIHSVFCRHFPRHGKVPVAYYIGYLFNQLFICVGKFNMAVPLIGPGHIHLCSWIYHPAPQCKCVDAAYNFGGGAGGGISYYVGLGHGACDYSC